LVVCLVDLVYLVHLVSLVIQSANQMNETNQTNKINQFGLSLRPAFELKDADPAADLLQVIPWPLDTSALQLSSRLDALSRFIGKPLALRGIPIIISPRGWA
jgi:hypothetical protein